MKYFLHDSNAFNDEKITMLFMNFGYEGIGLFFTILEKLASQEKPIVTEVLKHQLKVGKKLIKCWEFMEEIELISSNNGETFNEQLLNFSEKYKIKKEKNAKRILEWRNNQPDAKNVTCYESVRNTPKVKESKVNISKENIIGKPKKVFTAPSSLDVESFFFENGFTKESGKKAYLYYSEGDWTDSKGNKVLNWKQKMRSVWFKPENEIGSTPVHKLTQSQYQELNSLNCARRDVKLPELTPDQFLNRATK